MNEDVPQVDLSAKTSDTVKTAYTEPTGLPNPKVVDVQNIVGKFPLVSTTPTWTPSSFYNSFAIDTTNKAFYWYDFDNNVWVRTGAKRVVSITTASSYTIDTDSYDCLSITALADTINTITTSGTPTNFQTLIVRIKDNGTSQTINWSTNFVAIGTALPTATVISKVLTVGFLYDSVTSKWGCIAAQQE